MFGQNCSCYILYTGGTCEGLTVLYISFSMVPCEYFDNIVQEYEKSLENSSFNILIL